MSPVPGLTQKMLHANNSVCRPLQLELHQTHNEWHMALTYIKRNEINPKSTMHEQHSVTDNTNPEQYCKFSRTLDAKTEIYKRG